MKILAHRGLWKLPEEKNTIKSFKAAFTSGFGIELDVRDNDSKLIVNHDAFANSKDNLLFSEILQIYLNTSSSEYLAINIKSDGLAEEIKGLIDHFNIKNYFVFDMSIPEQLSYARVGLKFFTRVSEYEPHPIMLEESDGIWVDAFERDWYKNDLLLDFLSQQKKICIVSSELHGRSNNEQWNFLKQFKNSKDIMLCTDKPNEAKGIFL